MGITLADNRANVCDGRRLAIEDRGLTYPGVAWSSRIGISAGTEHPWRCFVVGCAAVSGQKGSRLRAQGSGRRAQGAGTKR
jgi:3-methyladenine DNA glycosylase Mpg